MEIKEQFINISLDALKKLSSKKLSDFDYKVYLYLCRKATFKYQVFGIYKKETFQTLKNGVNHSCDIDKDITAYKRSIQKLEVHELIKLQHKDTCLIISVDFKTSLADTIKYIENDYQAFTLYANRLKELAAIGVNIAAVYQNNIKQTEDKKPLTEDDLEKLGW